MAEPVRGDIDDVVRSVELAGSDAAIKPVQRAKWDLKSQDKRAKARDAATDLFNQAASQLTAYLSEHEGRIDPRALIQIMGVVGRFGIGQRVVIEQHLVIKVLMAVAFQFIPEERWSEYERAVEDRIKSL